MMADQYTTKLKNQDQQEGPGFTPRSSLPSFPIPDSSQPFCPIPVGNIHAHLCATFACSPPPHVVQLATFPFSSVTSRYLGAQMLVIFLFQGAGISTPCAASAEFCHALTLQQHVMVLPHCYAKRGSKMLPIPTKSKLIQKLDGTKLPSERQPHL